MQSWLQSEIARLGIPEHRPADYEEIVLPHSERTARIQRLHPSWALRPSPRETFAGIPNKRMVAGPSAIANVPPELAVAIIAKSAFGRDAWWAVWGNERTGVGPTSGARTEYPIAVADAVAEISAQTRSIMALCDERTKSSGLEWRQDSSRPAKGGLWDVLTVGASGALCFIECKREGHDQIRDNQRAFLEAALEQAHVIEDFAIISWRELG